MQFVSRTVSFVLLLLLSFIFLFYLERRGTILGRRKNTITNMNTKRERDFLTVCSIDTAVKRSPWN